MKKITITLIVVLTAISAMAQTGARLAPLTVQNHQTQQETLSENIRTQQEMLSGISKAAPRKTALPIVYDEIIRNQPEGEEVESLQRSAFCTIPDWNGMKYVPQTCSVGNYLKGTDGNLYIYDALGKCYTFSYLKLEPAGDGSFVLRTPQAIDTDYDSEGNKTTLYATRLTLQEAEDGFVYVPEMREDGTFVGDVKFSFKDGVLAQEPGGYDSETGLPLTLIALTNAEGEWTGFSTTDIVIQPFNEKETELPEDLETSIYTLSYLSYKNTMENAVVQAAFYGDDFYFKNPFEFDSEDVPDMWIKGTKENGKVVFMPQYIGLNESEHNYVFMKPATYGWRETEDGGKKMTVESVDKLVFDYDETSRQLTCREKGLMLINEGAEVVNPWAAYADPVFNPFADKPYTPANASEIELGEYSEDDGLPITFTVKKEDVNSHQILSEHLYYNLYFDTDEVPYTFDKETYSGLEEEITDVPVDFSDGDYFFAEEDKRMCYAYVENCRRVGIQMVYKGGNEIHRSEIVWCENTSSGITSTTSDSIASVTYYDLAGRRLSHPSKGISIRRITYSDGSQKITKYLGR
ncbi:hypothetical protein [Prevotella dentasini]|uniref:hypothetical protein n=1 Tax=Prevotella dentasini TaxID=589537 RepID=UPI0011DD8888|nr:hypothetical protein [Prevotella dentasini]